MTRLDVKRLGRFGRPGHCATGTRVGRRQGSGWEYAYICAAGASRIACGGLFPDERCQSAVACLRASVAYYSASGSPSAGLMTDNGPCYTSRAFAAACKGLGARHARIKPYTPKTNGKAERFIQTALREWDCARTYETSEQRAADFPAWMHMYNWHRSHAALGSRPPISWLRMDQGNLLMHHIYWYPPGGRAWERVMPGGAGA